MYLKNIKLYMFSMTNFRYDLRHFPCMRQTRKRTQWLAEQFGNLFALGWPGDCWQSVVAPNYKIRLYFISRPLLVVSSALI